MDAKRFFMPLVTIVLFGWGGQARAQWITQVNQLSGGWNGVYLHVDASYDTLDNLVGADASNPIEEIWMWQTSPTGQQFVESPQEPIAGSSWAIWTRVEGPTPSSLTRLVKNAAYLVKVRSNVVSYAWAVQGRPAAPSYEWTSAGLNFVGFQTSPSNPPNFDAFLKPAPELQSSEIYYYQGGELGSTNPVQLAPLPSARSKVAVLRDQAYWIRAGDLYNRYFGPFQLLLQGGDEVNFGETGGQATMRLRNLTSSNLTVTLNLILSETPVTNVQASLAGAPPLLVRGDRNLTNLTYGFTALSSGQPFSQVLAPKGQPGSEAEIVLGLDRTQMGGTPGDLFAGILQFTDSLHLTVVNVAVSARADSHAGLWVGNALVTSVNEYLKTYARATNQADFAAVLSQRGLTNGPDTTYMWESNSGRILVFNHDGSRITGGNYLPEGTNTSAGAVARPFPLRLIIHDTGSSAVLLPQVYYGMGLGSNAVLTTRQSNLLPEALDSARRISAPHLPWSVENRGFPFNGPLGPTADLTASVPLEFDDLASNPFIHSYHPDHDNLDSKYRAYLKVRGQESYSVRRTIHLTATASSDDFSSRTRGSQSLSGLYAEDVTFEAQGTESKTFSVSGTFTLNRISTIPILLTSP
jgi:hypothetical protein